jgi:hypothetical protein
VSATVHGPALDLGELAPIFSALALEAGNVVALTITPYTWAAAVALTDDKGTPIFERDELVITTRYGQVFR